MAREKKKAAKKKAPKKEVSPLANRQVIVVAPTVVRANQAAHAIQELHSLEEKPVATVGLPRGLARYEKLTIVTAGNQALPADWCEQMERRLPDVVFVPEVALLGEAP